ncbi:dynein axonemal assembly factor 6 isoform X2 [Petromyzon marinus]|uniref:Protein PIH1D3 isoform X2 n=1 Tax=Petromyzon marinus TaxID=7757 RepID=A0AAJ7T8H6_PETMA|nr:protein PIH1D3 isoform X2 [Petromyzon marinus]
MAELGFSSVDIAALAGLLAAGPGSRQDDDDDEGEERVSSLNRLGPGDIGPAKKEPKTSATVKPNSSKDIWDEDEVPIGPQYDDTPDHRLQPDAGSVQEGWCLYLDDKWASKGEVESISREMVTSTLTKIKPSPSWIRCIKRRNCSNQRDMKCCSSRRLGQRTFSWGWEERTPPQPAVKTC